MTASAAVVTSRRPGADDLTEPGLRARGFAGFAAVRRLREDRLAEVPVGPGVYAILRTSDTAPTFLKASLGGWFKGKDPTVPIATLRAKWIPGVQLLYVGKATPGPTGRSGLRKRLTLLLDYGAGKPVGHQGGRYLWQVEGSDDYLVAWRPSSDPTVEENALLDEFLAAHGAYPFANIAGPRG